MERYPCQIPVMFKAGFAPIQTQSPDYIEWICAVMQIGAMHTHKILNITSTWNVFFAYYIALNEGERNFLFKILFFINPRTLKSVILS